ncbi:argininosuccinate synthase domain-containing protein [Parvularcula dongshanensis]|uniref:argininosuccinate synthase n=1 Tax=Parvularcula dongshanensis TaxID=1173995 RepID=A0A840I252_9PROT|nr:argininosuccinate synthase domain-containing protein [Parvularcula dongshanensis]MBB4658415.1 argininosuccinate synthase [Parvularcula dongshanensis]
MSQKTVVLAFSGGLDTSYCVAALREQGWRVVTYYVHSGSVDPQAEESIAARAMELGAADHRTLNAGSLLWSEVVLPFLWGGARRQGRYPVLCADRYVIARLGVELADEVGADAIAHGCTGMGNDQVRFDVTLQALTERPVLAPIRDIQDKDNVREYEMAFLKERGFAVPERASKYSVNENLLGATLSGGPIDQWEVPGEDARVLTAGAQDWPREPLSLSVQFEDGVPVSVDGKKAEGAALLKALNDCLGPYGVGYEIYTGDTLVGLKGRIVFEAPGLAALEAAHTALCEAVSSREQNGFRRTVGEAWCDLVYDGRYYDPLRDDLEAYLSSSRRRTTGEVELRAAGGTVHAVAVRSDNILKRPGAVYAQKAAWTGEVAEGFTGLFGQSTVLWRRRDRE